MQAARSGAVRAYLGVGANLGAAEATVASALAELDEIPDVHVVARSSLYRTAPVGHVEQPDFINAVVALDTRLAPRDLLTAALRLERAHGRQRSFAGAPRTLDLDVLLYGEETVTEPGLVIPHPRMHLRAFVLVPLLEIDAQALVPGEGPARDLLARLDTRGVARLSSRCA